MAVASPGERAAHRSLDGRRRLVLVLSAGDAHVGRSRQRHHHRSPRDTFPTDPNAHTSRLLSNCFSLSEVTRLAVEGIPPHY